MCLWMEKEEGKSSHEPSTICIKVNFTLEQPLIFLLLGTEILKTSQYFLRAPENGEEIARKAMQTSLVDNL